jgi:hypothetical protein
MSRWSNWSRGEQEKPKFLGNFVKEALDTGNPAVGSSPAERARQLGLQSDGSGGYIDPETGQKVAATVNGELVFYDNRGMSGGAVSDGSGGSDLVNAKPTWSDPMTGLAITPPSHPESPFEKGAVPDAIPAAAPAGYDSFMNQTKMRMYNANQQINATHNVNNPMQAAPASGINPIGSGGTVDQGPNMELPGMAEGVGDNAEMRDKMGILPKLGKTFAQMRGELQVSPNPPGEEEGGGSKKKSTAQRMSDAVDAAGGEEAINKPVISKVIKDIKKDEEFPQIAKPSPPSEPSSIPRTLSNTSRSKKRKPDERDADIRWSQGANETDLIGETAFMQGLYSVLNGDYNTDILQYVGKKEKDIPEEYREQVQAFSDHISDHLPKGGLNKKWEAAAAQMVQSLLPHLDLNETYSISKADGGNDGMRMTDIPEEARNHTYDSLNKALIDNVGSESLLEMMGMDSGNFIEHHDPTDVVLMAQGAAEEIQEKLQDAVEDFQMDGDKEKMMKAVAQIKRDAIIAKKLFNISLKKPGKNGVHALTRNVSNEEDNKKVDDATMDLITDSDSASQRWGTDADNIADLTDAFTLAWKMKDDAYDTDFEIPAIIHSGNANKNTPFDFAGNAKFEGKIKGSGAKAGTIPQDWFSDPEVTEMLGYGKMDEEGNDMMDEEGNPILESFADRFGGLQNMLGIDPKMNNDGSENKKAKLARRFTEEEVNKIKELAQSVQDYDGNFKLKTRLPKGIEDIPSFIDKLMEVDNKMQDFRPESPVRSTDRNVNPYDLNFTDEQKAEADEMMGGTPGVNIRAIIRNKVRQLRYVKLLQELESKGKLEEFSKRKIYRKAMKMGNEFSPYFFLG